MPSLAFFDLLFGVIVIDCWLLVGVLLMQPIALRPAVVLGSLAFVAAVALCHPLQLARASHGNYTDDRIAVQRAMSADVPRGSTVLILSTATEAVFEQVLDRGWEWGSRLMSPCGCYRPSQMLRQTVMGSRRWRRSAMWRG